MSVPIKSLLAVVLLLVCSLFIQAWAVVSLRGSGIDENHAINLVRLIVLPILFFLIWLIVRPQSTHLKRIFSFAPVTAKLIITGISVGLLARLLSWSEVTARGAFGLIRGYQPAYVAGPSISFECPAAQIFVVAVIVWIFLVPMTEEFIHRGIIQSAFDHRGPTFAILVSATIFMLMHPLDSYIWVFLFGIVFGVQYWRSRTLWLSIITHATYDGAIPFDKLCMRLNWNPDPSTLPQLVPGVAATGVSVACIAGIVFLTSKRWIGSD